MKIIITESQYENVANRFKRILFKFWDVNGPTLSRQMYKLIGIDSHHTFKLHPYFLEYLVEWFGGEEKFIEHIKQNEGKDYHVQYGGYNFDIILDEITLDEFNVYLDVRVKPGGTVTLIFDENQPTVTIEDALANDNYGWEINNEIQETIFDTFQKYFNDLGIEIVEVDVDYM
jgi:hypothetical protein